MSFTQFGWTDLRVPDQGGAEWGMTLRDYFAAKAMQGMVARDTEPSPEQVPIIAASAYVLADAMLKAR